MGLIHYTKNGTLKLSDITNIVYLIFTIAIIAFLWNYYSVSNFTVKSDSNKNNDGNMTFTFLEKGIPTNYYMNPLTVNSPYKNKNFAGYWGSSVFSNSNYNAIKNIYKTTGIQL
jgi:hypothetical protein